MIFYLVGIFALESFSTGTETQQVAGFLQYLGDQQLQKSNLKLSQTSQFLPPPPSPVPPSLSPFLLFSYLIGQNRKRKLKFPNSFEAICNNNNLRIQISLNALRRYTQLATIHINTHLSRRCFKQMQERSLYSVHQNPVVQLLTIMMLAVGSSYVAFLVLRNIPSICNERMFLS